MILEIFNGYVRGHYNAFIHTVVSLTAEHERARTHTHIHSLYCRTTLLLENDSLRHLRLAVGRRVTNKFEALAHLPPWHPLADGRLIASAPCVGHLIIMIPLPLGILWALRVAPILIYSFWLTSLNLALFSGAVARILNRSI